VAGWRALWLRQGPIVVLWGGSRGDAGYCDMHVHCWGQGTPSNVRPPLPQFAAAVDGPFEGGGMFTVVGGVRIFNLGSSFTFSVGRGRLRMFSAVDFQTKMTPWQARRALACIAAWAASFGVYRLFGCGGWSGVGCACLLLVALSCFVGPGRCADCSLLCSSLFSLRAGKRMRWVCDLLGGEGCARSLFCSSHFCCGQSDVCACCTATARKEYGR
jgi:hypothetical protein